MNTKTHVIMTMAGRGQRFLNAGISTPKPLIKYHGKPLFINAIKSIDGLNVDTITFVVQKEHVDKFNIDNIILNSYPHAIILSIDKITRGAAETAYIGIKNLLDNGIASLDDSILIMDCDVIVNGRNWKDVINNCVYDGILLTFYSVDSKYSYAIEKNGKAIMLAEKQPISSHALTSPYFIKKIKHFIDAFNDMEYNMNNMTQHEMYMSTLYNFLIKNDKIIVLVDIDDIITLGTPEEIKIAQS